MFRMRSSLVSCSDLSFTMASEDTATGARLATSAPGNEATFPVPASFSSSLQRPATPKKTVCNMVALNNEGNTCFLNTTIQLLRATPNFTSELKSLASTVQSAIRKQHQTCRAGTCDEVCSAIPVPWSIVLELNNVYEEMRERESTWLISSKDVRIEPMSPTRLLDLLRNVNPLFRTNAQQDVHELWFQISEYIQEASSLLFKKKIVLDAVTSTDVTPQLLPVSDTVESMSVKNSDEIPECNCLDGYKRSRPSFRQSTIPSFWPLKNSTVESTAVKNSVEVLECNSLNGYKRSRPSFRQSTIPSFFPIKKLTVESTESALESCAQSSSLLHHCLSDDISSQEKRPCDFDEPADMVVDAPASEDVNVSQLFPASNIVDRFFKGELSVSTQCVECESSRSRSEVFTEIGVAVSDAVRCIKCDRINMRKAEKNARSRRRRKTGKGDSRRVMPRPLASQTEEQEDDNRVDDRSCSGDFSCVILKAFFDVTTFRDAEKLLCEICERRTDAHRRTRYPKMPPILTIQLRCFAFAGREKSASYNKVRDHLSAPMTLPCLCCFESGNADCTDDSHSRYFLYGVVVHIGSSINSGHYVCYVKVATESSDSSSAVDGGLSCASSKLADVPSPGDVGRSASKCSDTTWVLLDDANAVVCPQSANSLDELFEATGHGECATPYLLFYCRASASLCKSEGDGMQPKLCSDVAHSLRAVDGRLLRWPQPSLK